MTQKHKYIVYTIPAHGHINSILGLINRLVWDGNDVVVYGSKEFKDKFIGVEFREYNIDNKMLDTSISSRLLVLYKTILKATCKMLKNLQEYVDEYKPDIIVYDSLAFWGSCISKNNHIKGVSYCSFIHVRNICSQTCFKYSINFMWGMIKDISEIKEIKIYKERVRKEFRGKVNMLDVLISKGDINAVSYPKELQYGYSKYDESYIFLGPMSCANLHPHVEKIKNSIYVSLGTIMKNKQLYDKIVNTFKNTLYTVYIADCNGMISEYRGVYDNIHIEKYFDQYNMLGKVETCVTACGVNTVCECISNKVPMLLFPMQGEQKITSNRIIELGLGLNINQGDNFISKVNEVVKLSNNFSKPYIHNMLNIHLDKLIDRMNVE